MKFAFIEDHQDEFPIEAMCRVLEVSRSGYYAWQQRAESPTAQRQAELLEQIQQIHEESRQVYGSPRVYRELAAQGVKCSENTVGGKRCQEPIPSVNASHPSVSAPSPRRGAVGGLEKGGQHDTSPPDADWRY